MGSGTQVASYVVEGDFFDSGSESEHFGHVWEHYAAIEHVIAAWR